jgi:hypothetical protein
MMGHDRRRYGRANVKARIGIAAAVLAGGGAIGVVALASSHGASPSAQTAGYSARYSSTGGAWSQLNTALTSWGRSTTTSYNALASLGTTNYTQVTQNNRTFVQQRGVVVLATNRFIILQSANGALHLWLTSGNTAFQNVSNTQTGTGALTGSTSATTTAMNQGNLIPASTVMAGSPMLVNTMLAPQMAAQTVTVQVAGTNLTVTVTVKQNTATVSQTSTMPWAGNPMWRPTRWTQNPWLTATTGMTTTNLARGDLALIAGFRTHNLLHAQVVLFTPMTTSMVGTGTGTGTGTLCPTTPATTPVGTTPAVSSTAGSSGTHS